MKKTFTLALTLVLGFWLHAQELPQPSPAASTMQRVGLTDVEVKYSRPSVKEREIFGGLVPYDQLWRTGANKATAITFSTPVMIGETQVDAGTYSLFTVPSESQWTIILNKNTELWGTDGYEESMDVARIKATATEHAHQESFLISVENVTSNSADIMIAWDDRAVSFPIRVNTAEMAQQNITEALAADDADARAYLMAARYYLQNNMNPEQALEYIQTSLEMDESSWYSHYLHAEILAMNGEYDDAEDAAEDAKELGEATAAEAGEEFTYGAMIDGFLARLEEMED